MSTIVPMTDRPYAPVNMGLGEIAQTVGNLGTSVINEDQRQQQLRMALAQMAAQRSETAFQQQMAQAENARAQDVANRATDDYALKHPLEKAEVGTALAQEQIKGQRLQWMLGNQTPAQPTPDNSTPSTPDPSSESPAAPDGSVPAAPQTPTALVPQSGPVAPGQPPLPPVPIGKPTPLPIPDQSNPQGQGNTQGNQPDRLDLIAAKLHGLPPQVMTQILSPSRLPFTDVMGVLQKMPVADRLSALTGLSAQDKQLGTEASSPFAPMFANALMEAKIGVDNDIASPQWQARAKAIKPGGLGDANMLGQQFIAAHREMSYFPDEMKKAYAPEKIFTANQQPNSVSITTAAANDPNNIAFYGHALALPPGDPGAMTPATVMGLLPKGMMAGQNQTIMRKIFQAAASENPKFNVSQSIGQMNYGTNNKNVTASSQLATAYSSILHAKNVFDDLNNSGIPSLNAAINAGKVQTGDPAALRAVINAVINNDELSTAFSKGGGNTNVLKDMTSKLTNFNLSPAQLSAQADEVRQALERVGKTQYRASGGIIDPLKGLYIPKTVDASKMTSDDAKTAWDAAMPKDRFIPPGSKTAVFVQ